MNKQSRCFTFDVLKKDNVLKMTQLIHFQNEGAFVVTVLVQLWNCNLVFRGKIYEREIFFEVSFSSLYLRHLIRSFSVTFIKTATESRKNNSFNQDHSLICNKKY